MITAFQERFHRDLAVAKAMESIMAVEELPPLHWMVARVLPGNQLAQIRCETEEEARALYSDWSEAVRLLGGSVTLSLVMHEVIK